MQLLNFHSAYVIWRNRLQHMEKSPTSMHTRVRWDHWRPSRSTNPSANPFHHILLEHSGLPPRSLLTGPHIPCSSVFVFWFLLISSLFLFVFFWPYGHYRRQARSVHDHREAGHLINLGTLSLLNARVWSAHISQSSRSIIGRPVRNPRGWYPPNLYVALAGGRAETLYETEIIRPRRWRMGEH